jgi:hypothetical protein
LGSVSYSIGILLFIASSLHFSKNFLSLLVKEFEGIIQHMNKIQPLLPAEELSIDEIKPFDL